MTDFFAEPAVWEWPERRFGLGRFELGDVDRNVLFIVLGLFLLAVGLIWTWAVLRSPDVTGLQLTLIEPPAIEAG